MTHHQFPWSIKQQEFDYLRNLVIDNNCQRGFEVATAFGISGLAAALGFKETGGQLVTLDAYIEEHYDDPRQYIGGERMTFDNMDGYKSVMWLRKHFDLENTLFPHVGWSPTDTARVIRSQFGDATLDYAFIDANHSEQAVIDDIGAILPFMGKNSIIALHDVYPYCFTDAVYRFLDTFGGVIDIVLPHPAGENLGVMRVNV